MRGVIIRSALCWTKQSLPGTLNDAFEFIGMVAQVESNCEGLLRQSFPTQTEPFTKGVALTPTLPNHRSSRRLP